MNRENTDKERCCFCRKLFEEVNLVHHPVGGGANYACDKCVEVVPEIQKTPEGVFYWWPTKEEAK